MGDVRHPDYRYPPVTLEQHAAEMRDMVPHIDTLQRLASGARHVVEFGVRTGVSTWALLDAIAPDGALLSWDITPQMTPDRCRFDPRWTLTMGDSLRAEVPWTPDLVFIDTSHRYAQTLAELRWCAERDVPLIVLHDWNEDGVRDAVTDFCAETGHRIDGIEDSEWGMVWLRR